MMRPPAPLTPAQREAKLDGQWWRMGQQFLASAPSYPQPSEPQIARAQIRALEAPGPRPDLETPFPVAIAPTTAEEYHDLVGDAGARGYDIRQVQQGLLNLFRAKLAALPPGADLSEWWKHADACLLPEAKLSAMVEQS